MSEDGDDGIVFLYGGEIFALRLHDDEPEGFPVRVAVSDELGVEARIDVEPPTRSGVIQCRYHVVDNLVVVSVVIDVREFAERIDTFEQDVERRVLGYFNTLEKHVGPPGYF
jgi:hypothetical protein